MTALTVLNENFAGHRSVRKFKRKYVAPSTYDPKKVAEEIFVDSFAGGGGASHGIEVAIGRAVDVAINHDPNAIAMHKVNHPETYHYPVSVWEVDPREAAAGRRVALLWLSPDCKHFSKAKGGTPVDKRIRGLAWYAVRWAATVKPRVIILENVEEFKTWGPLVAKRDPVTGRLLKRVPGKDEAPERIVVSEPGEVVAYDDKVWMPDPNRKGETFRSFVNALRRQGYQVEWKELRGCDYGAATYRKRLFLIARCDGAAIKWPEPTHTDPESLEVRSGKLLPWDTVAAHIDWSLPTRSIFGRKKPIAENTKKRIYRGIDKFILKPAAQGKVPFIAPFIVKVNHQGEQFRGQRMDEPLQTITAKNGYGIVTPYIARIGQTGFAKDGLQYSVDEPLTTVTTKGEHLLITPTLIQMGYGEAKGQKPRILDIQKPAGTITAGGNKFGLVTTFVSKFRGTNIGQQADEPLQTVTAGGNHFAAVHAFMIQYNGKSDGQALNEPSNTITTKDRFGLIQIYGVDYQIVDIHMRMLKPRELFSITGFPDSYIIEKYPNGKKISEKDQVARVGNAVVPIMATSLVRENLPEHRVGSGNILRFERYKQQETTGQLALSL